MRPRAPRAALAAFVTLCAAAGVEARLPDWAQEIAASAPPVPSGITRHKARVLFRERRVTVEPDGTVRTRLRVARQILSARQEVGLEYFPFGENTRIEFSRAWHLSPEGKTRRSAKADFIDLTLDDAFLTDARRRIVGIDDVDRGSLVFFEFRSREVPLVLSFSELFYEPHPIDRAVLAVQLPAGWRLRHEWIRGGGPGPQVDGAVHRWELRDLEPAKEEPLGPDALALAPRLVLGPEPPAGESVGPGVFRDWAGMSLWYEALAEARHRTTPEIEAIAAELAGELPVERQLPTLARFVRDRVRYLDNEVGIGGYRPRAAGDTLGNRYGDCKDKATLLRSMLSSIGRESYPVLIAARHPGTVGDSVPSLDSFDHMILAVKLPEERVGKYPAAVVRDERLGPLLLLDTTDEFVSPGWLPSRLEGRRGLLVSGAAGGLIVVPEAAPEAHRIEIDIELALDPAGSFSVGSRAAFYGHPAAERRHRYRESPSDYRREWERELHVAWVGAEVEVFDVDPESTAGAFVETARWESPGPAGEGASRRQELFPGAERPVPEPVLRRRETPVRFPHRYRIQLRSTVAGLPPEAQLPEPFSTSGDGWSVSASFRREDEVLRAEVIAVLERKEFPPAELREPRRFFAAVRRATGSPAWLRPRSAGR